ncbi:MAG: sensor domain-containing diguanylate cyclase [Clostridia bacterium]
MKRNHQLILSVAVMCVLATCAVVSFINSAAKVSAIIEKDTYTSLDTLAQQQSKALKLAFDEQLATLRRLSAVLVVDDTLDQIEGQRLRKLLSSVAEETEAFDQVGLVDENGKGMREDGTAVSIAEHSFFAQAMAGGDGIEFAEEAGVRRLYFARPVLLDGQPKGVVYACYEADKLIQLLTDEVLDTQGDVYLTASDGTVLAHRLRYSYLDYSGNALQFYSEAVLENGKTAEQISQDLRAGKSGILAYSYGNQRCYVTYKPIGFGDWFVFNVLPATQVDAQRVEARQSIFELAMILLGLVALALLLTAWNGRSEKRARVNTERQLRQSERLLEETRRLSYTILFEVDPVTGNMTYNESFERQLGRKPRFTNLDEMLKPAPDLGEDCDSWRKLAEEMKRGVPKGKLSIRLTHTNGARIWYRISYECIYGEDKLAPYRIIGRIANIEWQEHERDASLAHAECDGLTGLMGHGAFMDRAEKRVKQNHMTYALLIADIDDFEESSQLGEKYQGDQLLVHMSDVLRQTFGPMDMLGRLGGDTFAVLMGDVPDTEYVTERADMLLERFSAGDARMGCSIGIAVTGEGGRTLGELSARADKALYRAKLAGKRQYQFFNARRADDVLVDRHGEDANAVLLRCTLNLITAPTLGEAMEGVLRELGVFYRADRAHVLIVNYEEKQVYESYVWRDDRVDSAMQGCIGYRFEDAPTLMEAVSAGRPLSVARVTHETIPFAREYDALSAQGITSLYMVPMGEKPICGYLCIDNLRDHVGSVTLIKSLAACVHGEIKKRSSEDARVK